MIKFFRWPIPSHVGKQTKCGDVTFLARRFTTGTCETNVKLDYNDESQFYIRKSSDRGKNDFGWLNSTYSFSFAPFYKENKHRGFRQLRVINEDIVQPSKGFETHSHNIWKL